MRQRGLIADPVNALLSLIAAASTWPIIACAVDHMTQSPLQRLLASGSAICGMHGFGGGEIMGHCPACYVGAAAFIAALSALSRRIRAAAVVAR